MTDRFLAEARAFLDAHAERRPPGDAKWGIGDDSVALFEQSAAAERVELDASRPWRRTVYDGGYGWLSGPREYGGAGRGPGLDEAFRRLETEYVVPSRGFFGIARHMLAPALLEHGTETLKRRYLASLHNGGLVACQLFSEPGAGSDLAGARTIARRDGHGWRDADRGRYRRDHVEHPR